MSVSSPSPRAVPAPGQAPLVAPNAAALLRRNAEEFGDRVAIKFGDEQWTHAEYYAESVRFAALFADAAPADRSAPRRGAARQHARLPLRVRRRRADRGRDRRPEPHAPRRAPVARHRARATAVSSSPNRATRRCSSRSRIAFPRCSSRPGSPTRTTDGFGRRPGRSLPDALAAHDDAVDAGIEPDVDSIWALIFTSGTSDAPKAVICSQRRLLVTGKRMSMIMDLGPRRHRLRVHAAVPLERGAGRLGAVDRHAVHGEPRPPLLRLGLVARHSPLPGDVLQLHGQAARVSPRAAGARRRRRQHVCGSRSATRVRRRWWRTSPAASASRSSTRTERPKAASRSTAVPTCRPVRSVTRPITCRSSTTTATRRCAPGSTNAVAC